MDELYEEQEELIDFARKNREKFKPVEQWLNEKKFDDFGDAWETAMIGPAIDWRRIVFIAWMASDKKIYKYKFDIDGFDPKQWCGVGKKGPSSQSMFYEDFLLCRYTTKHNPKLKLISNALEQGKKEVALDKNKAKGFSLDDLEHPVKCTVVAKIVRGMSHNIAAKLKRHQYPVVKVARHNYCEVEHAAILYPKKRRALEKYRKDAEE